MICRIEFPKCIAAVIIIAMLVLMIPSASLGANPWDDYGSRHPQRFWHSRSPDPAVMAADVLVVRPAALVATLTGGVFFLLSLPFSAAGGNTGETWKQLVASPARATFARPVGVFYLDFEENTDENTVDGKQELPVAPAATGQDCTSQ